MSKQMSRIIKTNLTSDIAYDVCRSILGQMSDGYWENTRKMEEYWRFASVKKAKGEIVFAIDNRYYDYPYSGRRAVYNGFFRMNDSEILSFFAKKIKFILRKEFSGISKKGLNSKQTSWLSCKDDVCVSDVNDVIRSLEASVICAGIAESSVD